MGNKTTDLGLYGKYQIERVDGTSAPGRKHHKCEYFVLDLTHDPHAIPAIKAYADSCRNCFPTLALDLLNAITNRDVGE